MSEWLWILILIGAGATFGFLPTLLTVIAIMVIFAIFD
jgi:hypothetical protein